MAPAHAPPVLGKPPATTVNVLSLAPLQADQLNTFCNLLLKEWWKRLPADEQQRQVRRGAAGRGAAGCGGPCMLAGMAQRSSAGWSSDRPAPCAATQHNLWMMTQLSLKQ